MKTLTLIVLCGLLTGSGCLRYASSVVRGTGGKIAGGVMIVDQSSSEFARERGAAEHEMYEACDNEATITREWDGVESGRNAHFFEFQCGKVEVGYRARKWREAKAAERQKKNADPCSEQNKAEMRASGMPESAIERACI